MLWDGRVSLCCADFDGRHILGDLRTSTIAEVWNCPAYRAARRQHLESGGPEICRVLRPAQEGLAALDHQTGLGLPASYTFVRSSPMRTALIVAVAALAFGTQVPGAAQAPAAQSGPKVQIKFEPNGLVTLETREATLREILAEWTRHGGSYFVNSERLSGPPLSLQFKSEPEKDVMASLLRQAAGYVLGPRRAGSIGVSSFEVVYILPTSNPSAGGYSPPPVTQYSPQITVGSPDDEIPPVGRGAPPPTPGPGPAPGPQPAPEYRPGTSAGSGVAVPVIAVPSGPVTPPAPSPTPTPQPGRGGNPGTSGS